MKKPQKIPSKEQASSSYTGGELSSVTPPTQTPDEADFGRRSSYDQESSSKNVTGLLWIDSGISVVFNRDAVPKYCGRCLLSRQIPSHPAFFRVELLERTD
jgi:hypothetical protein